MYKISIKAYTMEKAFLKRILKKECAVMNELLFTRMSYGLYLIAARNGGETDGCLTNTVTQITYEPNRIVFALNKQEKVHPLLTESKKAVISVLSTRAGAGLLDHFSDAESKKAKFRTDCNEYPYALTTDGIPYLLKQANAYLCCQIISTTDMGTHTLFLAECTDGDVLNEDSSFLYHHTKAMLEKLKPEETPSSQK